MPRDLHLSGIDGGSGLYWAGYVNEFASGFQATINHFMKVLLTVKGSNPFAPSEGTAFAELPGSNMGNRMDLVRSIIVEAVKDAETSVKRNQAKEPLLATERLRSASIESLTAVGQDGFTVHVKLENQAGQRLLTLLPHVSL